MKNSEISIESNWESDSGYYKIECRFLYAATEIQVGGCHIRLTTRRVSEYIRYLTDYVFKLNTNIKYEFSDILLTFYLNVEMDRVLEFRFNKFTVELEGYNETCAVKYNGTERIVGRLSYESEITPCVIELLEEDELEEEVGKLKKVIPFYCAEIRTRGGLDFCDHFSYIRGFIYFLLHI
ncbi:hypothetical protein RF11_02998 [Thelohanellus kitauei]|uniref:Uncharacterized protein n=1 Tax=Thelohanellus kitauei TaxID=669202 RepID=A0A0C2JRR6_THEKT|nr:hypothetical protein RF11_02998 [Thelohanellus kitauei]